MTPSGTGENLVGHDLHLTLRPPQGATGLVDEAHAALTNLKNAVGAAWPQPVWVWMHGPQSLPNVVAAMVRRVDGHMDGPESNDGGYYGPLGHLIATAAGRTFAFAVDLHGRWRGDWYLAIEPRLRRRFLGFITSDRIPGSRELDPATATALNEVVHQILAHHGANARTVPGNTHWQRSEILVFP